MIAGVGVDIVDVAKLAKLAREYPQKLGRIFTAIERRQVKRGSQGGAKLAEIFAAKEAVLKVLGTGWVSGLTWTDVEIPPAAASRKARLRGGAKKIAAGLKISEIWVDISSTKEKAVAQAVGLRRK